MDAILFCGYSKDQKEAVLRFIQRERYCYDQSFSPEEYSRRMSTLVSTFRVDAGLVDRLLGVSISKLREMASLQMFWDESEAFEDALHEARERASEGPSLSEDGRYI